MRVFSVSNWCIPTPTENPAESAIAQIRGSQSVEFARGGKGLPSKLGLELVCVWFAGYKPPQDAFPLIRPRHHDTIALSCSADHTGSANVDFLDYRCYWCFPHHSFI